MSGTGNLCVVVDRDPPLGFVDLPYDEVHWMSFAIEALAVLAALAFAVIQSR